jgi:hypothetical protein
LLLRTSIFRIICQNSHLTLSSWFYKILWSHTLLFLNDRWLVPAALHARAQIVYPSVSWHLGMCRSLKSPSPTYHKRHHQKRNLSRWSDTEDRTNEEHPPPSDTEDEKMYRILTGRLQALLEHLGITTAPQNGVKEVPHSGRVEFKAITEIFFGSRIFCRHKGPTFWTSRSDDVADAAW